MSWWRQHSEAWSLARRDPEPPQTAMPRYVEWIKGLPGRPVFVAYPAGFDFLFVYWYLIRFAGESPFSFSALDMKTYAMALLKTEYRQTVKRNMPRRWFDRLPHTHRAIDDALEQGALFINMLSENRGGGA
jgi:DNA polymerase III alpha subunit (gram-positive type)